LTAGSVSSASASRRVDQWLWFARLTKSRSQAARLCAGGAVTVNGVTVGKANQAIQIGDTIAVPQGSVRRIVRVVALGTRRGPAPEARSLYEEARAPVSLQEFTPAWIPLLVSDDELNGDF
jgi:ribosome-associated heat shock protein Hsp15